jgi:fatty acid desaturase
MAMTRDHDEARPDRVPRKRADTGRVTKRWWRWAGVYVVVAALAFLFLYWVIALFVAIVGFTLLVVGAVASNWEEHSTFEERELARAQKRKEKWERNAGAREKDRARWEAYQARKAGDR